MVLEATRTKPTLHSKHERKCHFQFWVLFNFLGNLINDIILNISMFSLEGCLNQTGHLHSWSLLHVWWRLYVWGCLYFCNVCIIFNNGLREASELKNVTKSGKSPQFSWPPLPQDVLDFFEFWKNSKFDEPLLVPNLGKIWNFEFSETKKQRLRN